MLLILRAFMPLAGHGLAGHRLAGHGLAGHGLAGHGLAVIILLLDVLRKQQVLPGGSSVMEY